MKFFRIAFIILGAAYIVFATVLWLLIGDYAHALPLILRCIGGVALASLSSVISKIHASCVKRKQERVAADRQAALEAAERLAEQQAAEAEAALNNGSLATASPDQVEQLLKRLLIDRPDLADNIDALLRQFDEARKNIDEIRDFERSGIAKTSDQQAFEESLLDITANAIAVIGAIKLDVDIDQSFERAIAKNNDLLEASADAASAILAYANMRTANRRTNPSLMKLRATQTAYAGLTSVRTIEKEDTSR